MLKLTNITKSFGDKLIFNGFSYSFPEKGIFALVGESGVGKTTLLRLIGGLDTDFSGQISGSGRKNISMAFQEYRLFPTLSALENVLIGASNKPTEEERGAALELLLSLGFSKEDSFLLPEALSGGMKMRVSLARAVMRKAPILLLDEPTKELDEENKYSVLDVIKTEGEKRLVIMVTHNKRDTELLSANIIEL